MNETHPNLKFTCQGCRHYCICPDLDNYPGGCTDFVPHTEIEEAPKPHLEPQQGTLF